MEELEAVRRKLLLLAGAFAVGVVVIVSVLAAIDLGEAESPDLTEGATLAATILGVVGLLVALRWWAIAGERSSRPAQLQVGFVLRVAIAELGLLTGILGLVMTGSKTGLLIGAGLFLVALLILALALGKASDR